MLTGFVLATGCQEILHTRKMGNIENVGHFHTLERRTAKFV
jgi:hypothetical protein